MISDLTDTIDKYTPLCSLHHQRFFAASCVSPVLIRGHILLVFHQHPVGCREDRVSAELVSALAA